VSYNKRLVRSLKYSYVLKSCLLDASILYNINITIVKVQQGEDLTHIIVEYFLKYI